MGQEIWYVIRTPSATGCSCQQRKSVGDVVYASLLGRSFIVLNSPEAINELLEKRSANYSDRPIQMLAGEMYVVSRCDFAC